MILLSWTHVIPRIIGSSDKDEAKKLFINMEDPIIRGMTCVHESKIMWPPPLSVTQTSKKNLKSEDAPTIKAPPKPSMFSERKFDLATLGEFVSIGFFVIFFAILAGCAPVTFITNYSTLS